MILTKNMQFFYLFSHILQYFKRYETLAIHSSIAESRYFIFGHDFRIQPIVNFIKNQLP